MAFIRGNTVWKHFPLVMISVLLAVDLCSLCCDHFDVFVESFQELFLRQLQLPILWKRKGFSLVSGTLQMLDWLPELLESLKIQGNENTQLFIKYLQIENQKFQYKRNNTKWVNRFLLFERNIKVWKVEIYKNERKNSRNLTEASIPQQMFTSLRICRLKFTEIRYHSLSFVVYISLRHL